jgi:hypothetical protein
MFYINYTPPIFPPSSGEAAPAAGEVRYAPFFPRGLRQISTASFPKKALCFNIDGYYKNTRYVRI